jgi:putative colanic acid biosysnthesis UDP-glucose lipid carrier transferase
MDHSMYRYVKHFLRAFIFTYHKSMVRNVVIIGYNDTARKLASYYEDDVLHTKLVGFVENRSNLSELTHYPVLCGLKGSIRIVKGLGVHEIVSTITPEQNRYIYDLIRDAERNCIRFKIVPDFSKFIRSPVVVDHIGSFPALLLRSDPLEKSFNRFTKRLLDLTVATFVAVFILIWMVPLLGILIKFESRGPVFFLQWRTGRNNTPFRCLKFRSMRKNQDADTTSAKKNDQRVTRIGSILRKSSLDEFPQFINVLLGDMSLVGPRPHMVKHTSEFSKLVDHYMIRQFLKPGITGWAQINSFRGEITDQLHLRRRIASDLWYLEHWSIWLDLRILFLTAVQVCKGDKQAY